MAIDVVVIVCQTCPDLSSRGASTPPFISKGDKVISKVTESVTIWSQSGLSLLAYFTYIFIDIIIYTLGSMPWSSKIFWMVGQLIADPSLGLPSLCGVVPCVPILISSPRVHGKWVDAGWSRYFLSVMNLSSSQFRKQVLWHKIIECFSLSWSNRCTY
jgi:hypothetical protein